MYADIHTHILPGVDDGAPDFDTAIKMLRMEKEQGVSLVVLTPHFVHGRNRYTRESLQDTYKALCENKEVRDLGIRLILGNEIYYSSYTLDDLLSGNALTLGDTNYVLVEFEPSDPAKKILKGCRELYNNGYKVILAHVERYKNLDDMTISSLMLMHVSFQANTSAVRSISPFSKTKLKSLMHAGAISFIASDAHDTHDRKPHLDADFIQKKYPSSADAMLFENAYKIFG